jgi:hypothetical protein
MKFGVFLRLTWIGSTDSSDLTASVSLPARKCVKTSGDVIKIDFNSASNGGISDLSPIPLEGHQAVHER